MKISIAVLEQIEEGIKDMLVAYQQEMEQAYLAAGKDPLDVKIGVKVSPDKGKQKIVTTINFVKDRCRDSSTSWVDDDQASLFEEGGDTDGV